MIPITADLLTRVDWIDEQHSELIQHVNALLTASADRELKETEEILHFLGKYVVKHFGDEEEAMLETGYPNYNWHHNWHQSYILKLTGIMEEFLENGISPEYLHMLDEFLVGWIVKHIGEVDVQLGAHIRAQKRV
jgi:hemerythrin